MFAQGAGQTPAGSEVTQPAPPEPMAAAPRSGAASSAGGEEGAGPSYGAGACLAGVALPPPGAGFAHAATGADAMSDPVAAQPAEEGGTVEAEPWQPPAAAARVDDRPEEQVPSPDADEPDPEPETSATRAAGTQAPDDGKKTQAAASSRASSAAPQVSGDSRSQPAAADALRAWWPAPEAGRLNLVYAGSAAFDAALVLLFDTPPASPENANASIEVRGRNGEPVQGEWKLVPANPRMLMFKAAPGRYTVWIDGELAASDGKTLGRSLSGPIHLQ